MAVPSGCNGAFRNIEKCQSQKLELVKELVNAARMKVFDSAGCAWRHPEAGTPEGLLKMRRFFANWDCSLVCKGCSCPKGCHKRYSRRTMCEPRYERNLCFALARAFRDQRFRFTFTRQHSWYLAAAWLFRPEADMAVSAGSGRAICFRGRRQCWLFRPR